MAATTHSTASPGTARMKQYNTSGQTTVREDFFYLGADIRYATDIGFDNVVAQCELYLGTDPKTGEYVQAPLQNNIPEGVDPLSADEIEARCVRFVTTVNQCVQENTIKKIMRKVQRKKNGTLYKGRLLRLAYLDLVDESGCSYELVAKNESDTQLCIELRSKVPVTRDFML